MPDLQEYFDCPQRGQLYPVIQQIQKQVGYPLRFDFSNIL